VIIIGSGGLIGSESACFLANDGFDVVGIEDDMRAQFREPAASTAHVTAEPGHDEAGRRVFMRDPTKSGS
jgi:glycine/D-amino acid oxidase-like deaminating enzyme